MFCKHCGKEKAGVRKGGFNVFSAAGRINGLKYFYACIMVVIGSALVWMGYKINNITWLTTITACAVGLLLFVAFVIATVKRLHDLGRHGSEILFLVFPVYNIWFLFKLFFFPSNDKNNEYGATESRSHYWQVPMVMVLVPVLLLGACMVPRLIAGRPVLMRDTSHSYDGAIRLSMYHPEYSSLSYAGSTTAEKPFSECTDEELAGLSSAYMAAEAEGYDNLHGLKVNSVSGLTSRIEEIHGKKFVHISCVVDFEYAWDGKTLRDKIQKHVIIGVHDAIEYHISIGISQNADFFSQSLINASIQSIRVGEDAVP